MMSVRSSQGFTLIELMISLAILSILFLVAVPSYKNVTYRSEIRSAQADLMALSATFDNRYQRTFAYTVVGKTDDLQTAFPEWQPTSDRFEYSAESTVSGYNLYATDTRSSEDDRCRLMMNERNIKVILSCDEYSGEWL